MAQPVKAPAYELDDLSSVLGSHMVERSNPLKLFSDLQITSWPMHTHRHAHTYTQKEVNLKINIIKKKHVSSPTHTMAPSAPTLCVCRCSLDHSPCQCGPRSYLSDGQGTGSGSFLPVPPLCCQRCGQRTVQQGHRKVRGAGVPLSETSLPATKPG